MAHSLLDDDADDELVFAADVVVVVVVVEDDEADEAAGAVEAQPNCLSISATSSNLPSRLSRSILLLA